MTQTADVETESAASPFTKKDFVTGLVFFLVAFLIYARTTAPDVLWGDSGEFQVISATAGLAHATGYPIYLLLGKLFSLIPINAISWRVDLLSSFMGAAAATGIYFLTKAMGARRAFALIAATVLLLNPLFWWQSTIAEVYAITAAFFVGFLTCAVAWRKSRDAKWLLWGGLIGGLCIGLHHTVILTLPALVAYLIVSKARSRDWAKAALGAAIGIVIALIGYFGLASMNSKTSSINSIRRSATAFGMQTSDFDSPVTQFKFLFFAKQWESDVFKLDKDEAARNADWYQREVREDFGWPAAVLAVVGLIGLVTSKNKRWPDALLLGLSWAILFFFILTFNPVDLEVDFIPSFLVIAALSGLGLQWIQNLFVKQASSGPAVRWLTALGAVAVVFGGAFGVVKGSFDAIGAGAPVFLTQIRRVYPYPVDNPAKAHQYAHAIVDHVEGNALIVTEWHYLYPFYYVALFDDDKPGIEVVEGSPEGTNGHIVQSMQDFIRESVATRPVYATQGGAQTPVDLYYSYYFVPVQSALPFHLYRLRPKS